LTSAFIYGQYDFITNLTTPYGTTRFTHETDALGTDYSRFIQAVDPLGGTERVEFRWSTTAIAQTAPAGEVPTGFSAYNQNLHKYNSLFWDKRAMALYPLDASKATITHWLLYDYESFLPIHYSHSFSTSVPHSVKKPLENRVWYKYPSQSAALDKIGTWSQPIDTARVLDDGTTQNWQATYNDQGQVTSRTDPVGRQTSYTYATNGIDILEVRQTSPGTNDLLATFANYTNYQPQSSTDAAGQTTTVTYNARGQRLTTTNRRTRRRRSRTTQMDG